MHDGAITFAIEGDVNLETYEDAVSAARQLIDCLDGNRHPQDAASWRVAPIQGPHAGFELYPFPADAERACTVAARVDEIAAAIVADAPIEADDRARTAAWNLARLTGRDGVEAATIATAARTNRIVRLGRGSAMVPEAVKTEEWYVIGEVDELCSEGEPYMMVIDCEYDHPVCCYANPAEATPRPARVGDQITVFGTVLRSPWFGRPLEVRNVTKAEVELDPDNAWQRARGALPWKPGDEPAEVTIRRIRGG